MTTDTRPADHLAGIGLVALTLVGWSSVPLFLRYFAKDIDGWTSNGWRYGAAALLWLPVLLAFAARRRLPAGLFKAALVPSAFNAIGQVCFTWAHYVIDPGLVTFSLRAHIVFVTVGAAMLFPSERLIIRRPLFLAGVAMVVLGTVGTMLLAPGDRLSTAAAASGYMSDSPRLALAVGVALAVAAGALFACYALSVRRSMRGVNSIVAFAAISQYTAGAMIALMLIFGDRYGMTALPTSWTDAGNLTTTTFALVIFSAIIGIALGHVGYYMSINRLGVAVSSGVLQLQPFCVSIASVLLFGEWLTGWQWVAGTVAVCGAGSMLYTQHRARREMRAAALDEYDNLPPDHVAASASVEDDQPPAHRA